MGLTISRMRLRNFKSFRKADIPFKDGFTAVIGSNASGKSNILDALLFVSGSKSLKSLRAGKMTELVNHDAKESTAKVEVEFRDGNKIYEVSRSIDRTGKSTVRLDKKKKGLNEVAALLEELGVNPKGHNITVQGDITKIIEMSPRQRREIIDEIAGIQEFEEKKEEAIKKLESVEKKIKDTNLVLKERKAYLEELQREREAALKHRELQDELRRSKATLLSKKINRIRGSEKEGKKRMEWLEKETAKAETGLKEIAAHIEGGEKKLEELTKKIIAATERSYGTLGKQIEEQKAEIRILKERVSNKRQDSEKKRERHSFLKDRLVELKERLAGKEGIMKEKEEVLDRLLKEIAPLEKEEKERIEEGRKKEREISGQEEEMREISGRLEAAKKSFYGFESSQNSLKREIKFILGEKDRLEGKDERAKLAGKRKALQETLKRLESNGRILGSVIDALKEMKNTSRGLRTELDEVQSKIEKVVEINSLLKEDASSLKKFIDEASGEERIAELKRMVKEKGEELAQIEREKELIHNKLAKLENEANERQTTLSKMRAFAPGSLEKLNSMREKKADIEAVLSGNRAEAGELKSRLEEAEKEKKALDEELKKSGEGDAGIDRAIEELEKGLAEKQKEFEKSTKQNSVLEEEKHKTNTKILNLNQKRMELAQKNESSKRELNEINIEISKNEVRLADLEQEYKNYEKVPVLENVTIENLEGKIPYLETEIEKLGAINMKAIEKFGEYEKEVVEVLTKCDKLDSERQAVLEMIDKIDVRKLEVFMECFNAISRNFGDIYKGVFSSVGQLGLNDGEDPTNAGLTIEAKYKEDIMKSIDAMSGGEKSMTALAFLFAIQAYDPAPFYVFDEADAALDLHNSLKMGRMLLEVSKKSQVIAITHNDPVIKQADQLIGVALNKQKSSVIGLRIKRKEAAKASETSGQPP